MADTKNLINGLGTLQGLVEHLTKVLFKWNTSLWFL